MAKDTIFHKSHISVKKRIAKATPQAQQNSYRKKIEPKLFLNEERQPIY
jgi:hypothetical protein